jgi:hypothetical protein
MKKFEYKNPKKMHMLQSLFYLTIAIRVSGIIIVHHREHKTTVTTASGNRCTVLLRVANSSTIATDKNTVQRLPDAVVRVVFVLLKMSDKDTRNM